MKSAELKTASAPPALAPDAGVRETIHFYLLDSRTLLGKFIDLLILFLNLLICALYVAGTYDLSPAASDTLHMIEIVVVFFFILEYIARIYAAPRRWRQVLDVFSIIDLAAIFPTLFTLILPLFGLSLDIGFLNTLRAFRIFRFLRFAVSANFFFGQTTMSALRLIRLGLTILIIFFVSSGIFYQVEHTVNAKVPNFGEAFYFTVVTLTTVGFGDITPVSDWGRWVTVLMILSGIVLIPWQAGQVVREWINLSSKTQAVCHNCGLKYHDRDASHCKSCGHVIYQEYQGD